MQKNCSSLILLFFFHAFLPAQHLIDFESDSSGAEDSGRDGRFEQIPPGRWERSSDGAISGGFSLHHSYDNPSSGCDFFQVLLDPLHDTDSFAVSFRVRHGYPPSAANNWQVAILAELESGEGDQGIIGSGLILGVNFTGSDDLVKLWEYQHYRVDCICTTTLNYQEEAGTQMAPGFTLVWLKGGDLAIYYTPDPDMVPFQPIGECTLENLPEGRKLLIRYQYSSARDRNLWIDDIRLDGNFVADRKSPEVLTLEVVDRHCLALDFSENVQLPGPLSFRIREIKGDGSKATGVPVHPDTVYGQDHQLFLRFPWVIPNRDSLGLQVTGICDADGNCLDDTLLRFMRNEAVWGDVVFTEVMSDPDPAVRLPPREYLEVLNRSDFELNLEDWMVLVNQRSRVISGLKLDPGQYGVLHDIQLPNDGADLLLYSREGELVHGARYSIPWNAEQWKREGGWSLESPDPELVCMAGELWEYSSDSRGGTPGRVNSNSAILEDIDAPVFLFYGYENSGDGNEELDLIRLWFSEPVVHASPELFTLYPGAVHPDTLIPGIPVADHLKLGFPQEALQGESFEMVLKALADCSGNVLPEAAIQGGKPDPPGFGSLSINEIMYDPHSWAPAFIELFNGSGRIHDLQDFSLDIVKKGELPGDPVPLYGYSRIVLPGDYLVIARDIGHLVDAYGLHRSGQWVENRKMPSFPSAGGTVYITDRSGALVDRAHYEDGMHMDLLDDTRGISLERLDIRRSGTDRGNWHSAASVEGYSTPGKANSQLMNGHGADELLLLEPKVFSPDNDGMNDLLNITTSSGVAGCIVRIWITDLAGNRIRVLANNHITGPSASYAWDGEQDDGSMVREGFYVVHLVGYDPSTGHRWRRQAATGVFYR